MKKLFSIFLLLCAFANSISAQVPQIPVVPTIPNTIPIRMHFSYVDPTGTLGHGPRTPGSDYCIYQNGNTLYFDGSHPIFTLTLLSGDTVVFRTIVDATDTSVQLPSELSGDYELQLASSEDFYYYADITL